MNNNKESGSIKTVDTDVKTVDTEVTKSNQTKSNLVDLWKKQ